MANKIDTVILPVLSRNPNISVAEIATIGEAKIQPIYIKRALADELITVTGKVETGKAGRPAHKFSLTDKGLKLMNGEKVEAPVIKESVPVVVAVADEVLDVQPDDLDEVFISPEIEYEIEREGLVAAMSEAGIL